MTMAKGPIIGAAENGTWSGEDETYRSYQNRTYVSFLLSRSAPHDNRNTGLLVEGQEKKEEGRRRRPLVDMKGAWLGQARKANKEKIN